MTAHFDHAVALIDQVFKRWHWYVYGTERTPAPPLPTAVAWAALRDDRWHVLWTNGHYEFARAYVTTPHADNPTDPVYAEWVAEGQFGDVAGDLLSITSTGFALTPFALPGKFRLPASQPLVYRPPQ